MKKTHIILFILVLLIIVLVWPFFFYLNRSTGRKDDMIRQGNNIIERIEKYRFVNNKLPNTLEDVGLELKTESNPSFYYSKIDSLNYILSFGTSLGESMYYYSDTRQWEKFYRNINNKQ